jgi:hypothetical protein
MKKPSASRFLGGAGFEHSTIYPQVQAPVPQQQPVSQQPLVQPHVAAMMSSLRALPALTKLPFHPALAIGSAWVMLAAKTAII